MHKQIGKKRQIFITEEFYLTFVDTFSSRRKSLITTTTLPHE